LKKSRELIQLDTERWLLDLGAEELQQLERGWWEFRCLNPDHNDHHPSMGYNEFTGAWSCFSCLSKGSGPVFLTMLALDKQYEEAVEFVLDYVIGKEDWKPREIKKKRRIKVPIEGFVELPAAAIKYLKDRGIPIKFAQKKGVKWSNSMSRIIIPITEYYWTARAIDDSKPKYLHTKGFSKSEVLYNFDSVHRVVSGVGVVEGVFDAWKVELAGFPCVATFGAGISNGQLRLLDGFVRLVAIPDKDQGGELFIERISKVRNPELWIAEPPGKDVGACTIEEVRKIWEEKRLFWKVYSHIFVKK